MAYSEIDESQFVVGGTVSISSFGQVVHDDFEDHETRLTTNETNISNLTNIANALLDKGRWYWNNTANTDSATILDIAISGGVSVLKLFNATETTPNNVSYSATTGLFTVANPGTYDIQANVELVRVDSPGSTTALVGAYIRDGSNDYRRGYSPQQFTGTNSVSSMCISAQAVTMAAGGTFGLYLICTGGQYKLHDPQYRSTNLGVQRTG